MYTFILSQFNVFMYQTTQSTDEFSNRQHLKLSTHYNSFRKVAFVGGGCEKKKKTLGGGGGGVEIEEKGFGHEKEQISRLLAANNWKNKLENMTASHTLKENWNIVLYSNKYKGSVQLIGSTLALYFKGPPGEIFFLHRF